MKLRRVEARVEVDGEGGLARREEMRSLAPSGSDSSKGGLERVRSVLISAGMSESKAG